MRRNGTKFKQTETERQLQFCTIEYLFSTIDYLFNLAQGFRMHGFFAWTGFMQDFKFQKIHTTCKWDLHDFKLKKTSHDLQMTSAADEKLTSHSYMIYQVHAITKTSVTLKREGI